MVLKVDVLILIEHKVRELDTAVLLKYYFEKRGYSVIIDSIRFNKENVYLKYNPKIIICPYAYSDKAINRMQPLCRFGNNPLFVNLHHEQIGFDGKYPHLPRGEAIKTVHISWGKAFTDKLMMSGCKEKSIITCGNPRLDFYCLPLSKINLTREELAKKFELDPSKKWILYIGDPGHLCISNINPGSTTIDDTKMLFYKTASKNRLSFFECVNNYIEDDCEFIYRPHPSYSSIDKKDDRIKEMMLKKRFHFISDESIRNWIINVDTVLTFSSTSIIECAAASIPFYLIRFYECPNQCEYNMLKGYQHKIRDYLSFYQAVKGQSLFDFSHFVKSISNEFTFDNNGKIVETIVNKIISFSNDYDIGRINYRRLSCIKTRIRAFLKTIL